MKKSVIEYLEETVAMYSDKVAVRDAETELTFKDLWINANKVANAIETLGCTKSPIGVYLPKSGLMVTAFAGISMSCNFYVPLDTKSPDARVLSIINTLETNCIITNRKLKKQLESFFGGAIVVIDEIVEEGVVCDDLFKRFDNQIDTDPLYTIFTSGSTGIPKGVVISHKSVIDYIEWLVHTFCVDSSYVIGNQAPFYFDNSVLDIYLMYATGATLDIIPETYFSYPIKLIDYLNNNKINFIFWVPSALVNVANYSLFETSKPKYLKNVFFCGEVMPNKHLNYWRKHLPQCRYANLYGPTEITDVCAYYIIDRSFEDDDALPIGKACRNTEIMILVNRERIADRGELGELCVRGTSLALGYYKDKEKTNKAFIQNPLNHYYEEKIYCTGDLAYINDRGEIMYVGRMDSQIKHNGYRIELGEIENAVLNTQMVDNCCAFYDNLEKKIVLFYQSELEIDMGAFRRVLSEKIPRYMFPSVLIKEERLRQNANGKIDRSYYNKLINK